MAGETCTKCGKEPRAGGSVWGRACLAEQKRAQRAAAKKVLRAEDLGQELPVPPCADCAAHRAALATLLREADRGLLFRLGKPWADYYAAVRPKGET